MNKQISLRKPPEYSIIIHAKRGNPIAMNAVLQHYSGYITHFATRVVLDQYDHSKKYVDEYIRRSIETKLIDAIITKFEIK